MSRELAPDQDGPQRSPHPHLSAQSATVTRPATGAAAPRTPAPLRTPAGMLGLQRLAGNRAVSALLSQGEPTVQRLVTKTGLKTEHARRVLSNNLKGDPPFKPQRGNFGAVSWFAGSGNPYVGGQAQSYNVMVDVNINPDPARLPVKYFSEFKDRYVKTTGANLRSRDTHHDFWVALGKSLEGGGSQEVPIDKSEVGRQGGGTFVVVGGSARESIRLVNSGQLAQDLGYPIDLEEKVKVRNEMRGPAFTVVFDKVTREQEEDGVPRKALERLVNAPASYTKTLKVTPAGERGPATAEVTLTLRYEGYTLARVQAKKLATAIDDGKLDGYTVRLLGGSDWSAKATRSYRR